MKRTRIDSDMVADYHVLAGAAVKAARGKRRRADVEEFFQNFDGNIAVIRRDLIAGRAPYNNFRSFTIYDPKERLITAVGFEDRIIHHALMNFAGPVLEKAMIPFTYACRPGKGPLCAVNKALSNIRKYHWYVKRDLSRLQNFDLCPNSSSGLILTPRNTSVFLRIKIFAFLDLEQISMFCNWLYINKYFEINPFFNRLLEKILNGYSTAPGKGLPIGSLTSQHFANYYLDGVDRFVLEKSGASAYVRYMDDMIWWADSKAGARDIFRRVRDYIEIRRGLTIKENVQIQRSRRGATFCGFHLTPGGPRLTKRKKRRYEERKKYWEARYMDGAIDALQLQRAYDSVHGVLAHASAGAWLRRRSMLRLSLEA